MRSQACLVPVLGSLLCGLGVVGCSAWPGADDVNGSSPGPWAEGVGVARSALGTSALFSTGVQAPGMPITPTNGSKTDPHYRLVATSDTNVTAPFAAFVVAPDTNTQATWVPNSSSGQWISAFADTNAHNTAFWYTYRTTFTLDAGIDPAKLVITGAWACDDTCSLTLNGVALSYITKTGSSALSSATPFAIREGDLHAPDSGSTYALDFIVTNGGRNQTGLLVTALSAGCTSDSQCGQNGAPPEFCDTEHGPCTAKLGFGVHIPTIMGHTPALTGSCTVGDGGVDSGTDVGAAVCASGVCDVRDDRCGYAIGGGPCTSGNEAVVCRTGKCDTATSRCGCAADGDCTASQWCNTTTHACTDKLGNDVGPCTPASGAQVCQSGVCDTDNKCGYPDGHVCSPDAGVYDAGDAGAIGVCRSGLCGSTNLCGVAGGVDAGNPQEGGSGDDAGTIEDAAATDDAGNDASTSPEASRDAAEASATGCTTDADCSASQWCNTQTATCTAKIANGQPLPSVSGHTPTLNGTCTLAAAAAVCESGVCDADNKCGYGDGHNCSADAGAGATDAQATSGSDAGNSAACRSGICSLAGVCGQPITPSPECTKDSDCSSAQWCNTTVGQCTAKIANGQPLPSVSGHTPTLNGACTATAALAVCQTGVCDTTDNKCGYANGHGPCSPGTALDGGSLSVCRSGTCTANSLCGEPGVTPECTQDSHCQSAQWCNTETQKCQAKVPNGTSVPAVAGHTPALTGTCGAQVAAAVCQSGVCDTTDNKCGLADGHGPCSSAEAGSVLVCRSNSCNANGQCGPALPGCSRDSDCGSSQWCNTASATCVPKLANGTPVPATSGHNPPLEGTCSPEVGAAVCLSGVCDPKDLACGYADGDGPCTAEAAAQCRSGRCSSAGFCGTGCAFDSDCDASHWCNTATHACTAKLDNGLPVPVIPGHDPALSGTCTEGVGSSVCLSGVCDRVDNRCGYANGHGPCTAADGVSACRSGTCIAYQSVCGEAFVPSGNGVACSAARPGPQGAGTKGGVFGGLLALAMLLAKGRRRARSAPTV